MVFLLVLVVLSSAVGVALFVRMRIKDDPFLGVMSLVVLDGSGIAAAAYGMLSSV
jgi:hypothetical protein